jgi:adhesin/invasin
VSGANQTTGADGVATVESWTLGGTAGANTLRATVGVDGVTGNPVTFTATATGGAPDPGKSTVSAAPGTIAASQGSAQSTITVVVRDALGNPLAGQAVTLSATGAGVTIGQPGPSDASGTTTGTFSATGSGVHAVSAKVGAITLGSANVTVTAGPPDASRTSVSVPNGSAGTPTAVQVSLQDQFGNPVGGSAGQIKATASGANAKDLHVEDLGGGSYRATYTPVVTGTDQIDVRVGGTPAPGSPFTSTVVAGAAAPGRTTADVPSDGQYAQPLEIIVHVADALGNPLGRGGDQVTVLGGDGTTLNVEDRGDGSYRAVWVPFVTGRFKIPITLNGTPIKGSPYDTRIRFFN